MLNNERQKLIEDIKLFIAKDELENACRRLQEVSDMGYQFQGSLTDLNKRYDLNVIDYDTYKREKNRISMAILSELKDLSIKEEGTTNHDGLKASNEDVNQWKIFFSQSTQGGDYSRARYALDKWNNSKDFADIGHRKWRETPGQSEENDYRFWGLYNIRPHNNKWVWIAWDHQDRQLVIIKEVNPNFIDREERISHKISWEIATYNKLKQYNNKGLLNILDSGDKWFASSLEMYGSLKWHLVGVEDTTGSELGEMLHHLYIDIPDLDRSVDQYNWPVYQSIFVQSLEILSELHDHGYVNRDLHRDNILIAYFDEQTKNIEVKICDLDNSRKIDGKEPPFFLNEQFRGSYIAPERLELPRRPNENASDDAWKRYYETLEAYHGLPACDVYGMAAIIANILLRKNKSIGGAPLYQAIEHKTEWKDGFKLFLLRALSGAKHYQNRPSAKEFASYISSLSFSDIEKPQKAPNKWMPLIYFLSTVFVLSFVLSLFLKNRNTALDDHEVLISGIIPNNQLKWTPDKVYKIMDDAYVVNNTLKIEPGTKVFVDGGKGLFITRNAQIEAVGTADAPIIFTSLSVYGASLDTLNRMAIKPWKGINIYGQATINGDPDSSFTQYIDEFDGNISEGPLHYAGGKNNEHSSGILKFVRIEYPGYSPGKDRQYNGLTLLGVGAKTQIEQVFIANAEDDAIEIIGGTVNLKRVICQNFEDDAIDWEYGWTGKAQFLLVLGRPSNIKKQRDINDDYAASPADPRVKNRSVLNGGNASENLHQNPRLVEKDSLGGPQLKNITVYLDKLDDQDGSIPFLRCELPYNLPVVEDLVIVYSNTTPDSLFAKFCNSPLEAGQVNFTGSDLFIPFGTGENFYKPSSIIPSTSQLTSQDTFFEAVNYQGAFENRSAAQDWDTGNWSKLHFPKNN